MIARYRKPAPLSERHIAEGFDCGRADLDRFILETAITNQSEGYSRTFVIADADDRIIGYHSLSAAMINRNHTDRKTGGHGAPREIPVALLARLAVDRRHQNNGLGMALLDNAIRAVVLSAQSVAFRAIMVHAIDDEAPAFYLRFGFLQAKGLPGTLLLPLKDIIASLQAAG